MDPVSIGPSVFRSDDCADDHRRVYSQLWNLKFLTLEIRTYAALVFFTTLAIYAALRATAQPNWLSLICAMLAYCLLVSSHTFGIIYVSSIVICTVLTAAVESNFSLALQSGLAGMPAIVMFLLWIPVLHSQAQLGNWIPCPDLRSLLDRLMHRRISFGYWRWCCFWRSRPCSGEVSKAAKVVFTGGDREPVSRHLCCCFQLRLVQAFSLSGYSPSGISGVSGKVFFP